MAFLSHSCSNEIDILADWKETMVVYGLIDIQQPVQYIKINKTFTNPGSNAYDVARIADSLFYDSLDVRILEENTGRIIHLNKVDSIAKSSGIFNNNVNYLYATSESFNPSYSYRIYAKNTKTGYFITAKTNIAGNPINIINPVPIGQPGATIRLLPDKNITFRFSPSANCKLYDVKLEFVYDEFPASDTTKKVQKSIVWEAIRKLETNSTAQQLINISGLAFYDFLKTSLREDVSLRRRVKHVNVYFLGANNELLNYINASEPSIGIVQKQTDYSNIANGLGLFASRNITAIKNIPLDNASAVTIVSYSDIKKLNFVL